MSKNIKVINYVLYLVLLGTITQARMDTFDKIICLVIIAFQFFTFIGYAGKENKNG